MKTTIINKILLVLMLITAQQVSALEFQVDGIYYRTSIFTKNSAYVTHSGTSYTESVEYQGEVVIPESVTYNGKTYTIASIGGYAFAGCPGLTSVTIPNTVTTINQNAFNGCTGLKTIECKATTPPALGDNAFTSYDATLVVPSSSESVYKSAAGWSNFKFKEESSETPGSGENSGEDSGSDNSGSDNTYGLACKILNSTDVAIIAGTEKYTGDIVIPSQVTISGKTYTVTSIANDAFKGCTGLTSITIPSSITSIGSSSFDSCTNLNKVSISDMLSWCKITFANSLANPLYYAKKLYLNGELLTGLIIPDSIKEIKNYAFYGCSGLTSITIPNSVTSIGNYAFYDCDGLTSVIFNAENCETMGSYDYPVFKNCAKLSSVTIGENVKNIPSYAFLRCTGLTSITIPNSVTSIGSSAFSNCSGLTSITIPNSVTSIGSSAFYGCTSLTNVSIPNSVTVIGNFAFYGCTSLTNVSIPNSVTSIGNVAFYGCSGLTSVIIGSSVTSIDNFAFYYCSGLSSVISLSTTPPMCGGTSVFGNVSVGNITLEVPAESVSLYQSADTWKDFGIITAVSSASRSESSGIDDILADGDEVEYYNLHGVRIVNPTKGIYIKREGNKVTKVVL